MKKLFYLGQEVLIILGKDLKSYGIINKNLGNGCIKLWDITLLGDISPAIINPIVELESFNDIDNYIN